MKLAVSSLTDFDFGSGVLTFTGRMVVRWVDEVHTWNTADFGNVSRLGIAGNHIWTPRLKQLTYGTDDFISSSAFLHNNGTVYMILAGSFVAYCDLNNYNYPVDEQKCTSTIVATEHDSSELNLTFLGDNVDFSGFNEHGGWEVVNPQANIGRLRDRDSNVYFVAHFFTVTLKRRPKVIMLHSAVPFFLTALLNTMIYCVPVRSGERITFAITILLTFVFFTTSFAEDLPRAALTTPLLSIILASMNCLCTFNVVVSVLFSRLANECIVPVPDCLKKFARRIYHFKITKMFGAVRVKPKLVKQSDSPNMSLTDVSENLESPAKEADTKENPITGEDKTGTWIDKNVEITWPVVIDVIDMLLFCGFLFIVILVGLAAAVLLWV